MRKRTILTALVAATAVLFSCSDLKFGDDFLGTAPERSGATLDTMFSSKLNAEKVLTQAYSYLPYGIPTGSGAQVNKLGSNILESITDLGYTCRDNIGDGPMNLYYNGALTASVNTNVAGAEIYRFGSGEYDWNAIRYGWMFIENVGRVPDMSPEDKQIRAGEARMIVAIAYLQMLRNVGGVPWLDHAVDINESMTFPRLSFAQTVDNIVQLLDQAAAVLPWKWDNTNDGRMTKAGALGLKVRLLLFAASKTFNAATPWHPAADAYTCYGNYDRARWQRALAACEEFMTELTNRGVYQLIEPAEPTHEARRKAYQQAYYDRGGTETLVSTRRGYADEISERITTLRLYLSPTLNYVDMFPWADGSDFPADFNWSAPSKQPFFDGLTPTRDPRLYEIVAVPGSVLYNGTPSPVYINHPTYNKNNAAGMAWMKFVLQTTADRSGRPTQWPHMRLPEVFLSYAEALNEVNSGPNFTAYRYANMVRSRVGLSELPAGMDKEQFAAALLHERCLEFGCEEVRWYDMVRLGREDLFRRELYGLQSTGNDPNNPTTFTFKKVTLPARSWVSKWNTKWYLSPIPQTEVNKNYGMTQNPGW